jgi:hypothetical protein
MVKRNTIQKQKKPRAVRRPRYADEKFTGPEPDQNVVIKNSNDPLYHGALCWYNYYFSLEEGKQWLVEYLKTNKQYKPEMIKAIQSAPVWRTSMTVGIIAKLLLRGWKLPKDVVSFFNVRVTANSLCGRKVDTNGKVKKPAVVISIQDRIRQKAKELKAKLDDHLDMFTSDESYTFSMYNFLSEEKVSPVALNMLQEHCDNLLQELKDKEGYDYLSRARYKKWLAFYNGLIEDLRRFRLNNKVGKKARKPRKVKEKPVQKQVEKLKYMKSHAGLKLRSVDPTQIIKAQGLWVYNTKYRQLAIYYAANDKGLGVKGTTITNFDSDTSLQKRVRKPEQTLPQVLEGGKVTLRRMMDSIKTTGTVPKGRTNMDIILLRVIK